MPTENAAPDAGACRYITTAIPYVNGAPHIGFALEAVQADTLARLYRQQGFRVRLQAGTDENSMKNVRAANAAGIHVTDLVALNAGRFAELRTTLNLTYDDFIRTSADPRHRPAVEALWKKCFERGDIYKRVYSGLYCTGCEQFYKDADLVDGLCPEHGTRLDWIEEENWFFRLSSYESQLRKAYAHGEIDIVPVSRLNEVLSWLDGGLEDFSISRSATRASGWGIPVPGDPSQVIYVWFDALVNYISALGFGTQGRTSSKWWDLAVSREHVVGKGITRFHAIYWPAMLLSANLPLPTRILVHGYVTAEGRKIGKSTGNAVDPTPLAQAFGPDALRYFLLRHIRTTGDGDFSYARFRQAYESELAGQLGNLVHRVLSMIDQYFAGVGPWPSAPRENSDWLLVKAERLPEYVEVQSEAFAFDRALEEIWSFIADCNRYVAECAPWVLAKGSQSSNPSEATKNRAELAEVLSCLLFSLWTIAKCLRTFLPDTSLKILSKLGIVDAGSAPGSGHRRVEVGLPLFPRK